MERVSDWVLDWDFGERCGMPIGESWDGVGVYFELQVKPFGWCLPGF